MNAKDFVNWMRGFVNASSEYNLTPQAWTNLKQVLDEVQEDHQYFVKANGIHNTEGQRNDTTCLEDNSGYFSTLTYPKQFKYDHQNKKTQLND
jgi:hypothetical protein